MWRREDWSADFRHKERQASKQKLANLEPTREHVEVMDAVRRIEGGYGDRLAQILKKNCYDQPGSKKSSNSADRPNMYLNRSDGIFLVF